MSNNIPIMDKEYYKEIVVEYLREHKKGLFEETIQEIAESRAKLFIMQMEESSDPMMDKEVFYQQMLEF